MDNNDNIIDKDTRIISPDTPAAGEDTMQAPPEITDEAVEITAPAKTAETATTAVPEETPQPVSAVRARVEHNIDLLGADRARTPGQLTNVLMSVLMAVIGLVFIGWCDQPRFHQAIMAIAGLAFVIPGLALLLSLFGKSERRSGAAVGNAICGVVSLILGVVILVSPDMFKPCLVYLFGGVLILIAIWQFYVMLRRNRVVEYPGWLKLLPVLVAATGIVMCVNDVFRYTEGSASLKWTMLAAGCGLTVVGLTGLIISYYAARNNHTVKRVLALRAAKAKAAGKI